MRAKHESQVDVFASAAVVVRRETCVFYTSLEQAKESYREIPPGAIPDHINRRVQLEINVVYWITFIFLPAIRSLPHVALAADSELPVRPRRRPCRPSSFAPACVDIMAGRCTRPSSSHPACVDITAIALLWGSLGFLKTVASACKKAFSKASIGSYTRMHVILTTACHNTN